MSWALRATLWLDASHGCVTLGKYAGNLLRAGQCNGPYIDMFLPGVGWHRIDNESMPRDKDVDLVYLSEHKTRTDEWLFRAVKPPNKPPAAFFKDISHAEKIEQLPDSQWSKNSGDEKRVR